MLVIGLTGNIAAGKSAVAARLAAHGAPIVDADLLAREAVAPGSAALKAIAARFGAEMLTSDGSLDRAALRQLVFRDADARAALNAIVHPEVARLREVALAKHRAAGAALVVCDIPLLFETGLDAEMDRIVLVDAPVEVRRERLMRDRGLPAADADAMIAAQMPAERKRPRAHYIIENDGSRDALDAQVDAVWTALRAAATA
ncbi:MAG TPA: dephospho-CoA kinase [Gemmatimonadaceae bacterium]|nr:dephospho-CoA kinase [Gemmatimonadaceae bacterium]